MGGCVLVQLCLVPVDAFFVIVDWWGGCIVLCGMGCICSASFCVVNIHALEQLFWFILCPCSSIAWFSNFPASVPPVCPILLFL